LEEITVTATDPASWPATEITSCPFDFYASLRSEQPVYRHPDRNEYYVTRWDDLVEIARTPEIFSNDLIGGMKVDANRAWTAWHDESQEGQVRPGGRLTPYASASSDPPEHKLKRRFALNMVTTSRLRSYEPMIRGHINDLIDGWITRGACDFRAEFADWLPVRVVSDILGLPREDWPLFQAWGDVEAGGAARYVDAARIEVDAAKNHSAAEYMRRALLLRRETPTDDFLSEMIKAQIAADGEFDLEYLTSEAALLLFAGNTTTAHMLASTMALVCQSPELVVALDADPSLAEHAVEESLRYASPVQWTQRLTKADATINGVTIPAGAWVIMFWASGNRDETKFSCPADYELERNQRIKRQLAFGHGIHRCAGAPLARLEGKLALETLIERLTDLSVDDERSDLRNLESVRFRVPRRLMIRFTARDRALVS
jgi:cytochrome P450